MTDNEIIKALECCAKDDCDNCPNGFGNCYANLAGYALDIINRQQAEIERLLQKLQQAQAEAIKEFAERLQAEMENCAKVENSNGDCFFLIAKSPVDGIAEEMVGAAE